MKILSVQEMRSLDNLYIDKFGIPQEVLMENASLGAFEIMRKKKLHLAEKILLFCGSGNNGGDGIALARKIFSFNDSIKVYFLKDPNKFKDASLTNFKVADNLGIQWETLTDDCMDRVKKEISETDVIVDAIFGTGLDRDITGTPGEIIDTINLSKAKIISLDIPSGLNGNNGCVMGRCIEAYYTISFGTLKYGHLIGKGRKYCGKLFNCNISFPTSFTKDLKTSINIPDPLFPRDATGHKGSFGKALFVSGSRDYLGAPLLNSYSFLHSGGGYATLFSTEEVIKSVSNFARELVFNRGDASDTGSLSLANFENIMEASKKNDVLAIGSGISLDPQTLDLARKIVENCKTPIIIDGDGITAISENLEILKKREFPTILTPHIVEFSRLTGFSIEKIQKDRINILRETAKDLKSYIVLKDATTIIASPEGELLFSTAGNSGMGVAGSGDLLVGIIAVNLCNLPPLEACSIGVFIHGYTGDLTCERYGEEGVLPTRMLENISLAIKNLRKNHFKVCKKYIPIEI
ncbi:NAD(P)H-hydrate dehydratase [uncultured Ilyobacter sp.]|uniref:NAD(P)H-hydrate dehydratase n=1 Tax=uncultured Ilyobacter sp. TaxID=544433 RepID=UPI002AA89821|nr:NAD(P)H-hydrate dehydratase [uncultured Ilyobacter sp.]